METLDKDSFCSLVCDSLGIQLKTIIKSKRGNLPEISFLHLLEAIYTYESLPKTAESLGISLRTLNRLIDKVFINFPIRCASKTWRARLLELCCDYKKCSDCKQILPISSFYKSNENKTNWSTYKNICKECDKKRTRIKYAERPHIHRASNARYKAAKLKAIPKWANLLQINSIYENCPEGYEVDHIIPLQGENVCGLHVENNLQYLTPTENRVKNNKF